MNEPLLTITQVAARLTVSRRTVERLVKTGRIRVVHPSPGRSGVTLAPRIRSRGPRSELLSCPEGLNGPGGHAA